MRRNQPGPQDLERAVTFDVGGIPLQVAAIDDLIALKKAVGRPIDLADIEHLQRVKEQP